MYMDCKAKLGRHARLFGDIGYGAAGKAGINIWIQLNIGIYISICLSIDLSIHPSICLSIYLHLSIYPSIYLYMYLSVHIYIYIHIYTHIYIHSYLYGLHGQAGAARAHLRGHRLRRRWQGWYHAWLNQNLIFEPQSKDDVWNFWQTWTSSKVKFWRVYQLFAGTCALPTITLWTFPGACTTQGSWRVILFDLEAYQIPAQPGDRCGANFDTYKTVMARLWPWH